MVGQWAQTHIQPLLQLAGAQRVAPEPEQDPQPDRMAQEAEEVGQGSEIGSRGTGILPQTETRAL